MGKKKKGKAIPVLPTGVWLDEINLMQSAPVAPLATGDRIEINGTGYLVTKAFRMDGETWRFEAEVIGVGLVDTRPMIIGESWATFDDIWKQAVDQRMAMIDAKVYEFIRSELGQPLFIPPDVDTVDQPTPEASSDQEEVQVRTPQAGPGSEDHRDGP